MPAAAALSEEFVVVGAPATAPAALSLGVSAGRRHSPREAHRRQLAMISLAASAHEPKARLPLEIVAVVDRSGSMRGDKIAVMKETLSFLVSKGLQSGDSLAIVSFDDTVEIRLPLSTMDAGGKSRAIKADERAQPGRTTNLSGGLPKGSTCCKARLCQSAAAPGRAALHRRHCQRWYRPPASSVPRRAP